MSAHKLITIEDIYKGIRNGIVDRSIHPGKRLKESYLSKEWNVSRTPIREVLRRLESEGFVNSQRYKGFVVNTISIEDVDQVYTIKMVLEGLAGRLATPSIKEIPEKLKKLEKLCKELEELGKKGDIEGYICKNDEFHFFISHSCGNKWLIKILENLSSQINRFIIRSLHIPYRIQRSVPEHWKIYNKIEIGDAKGVEKAIGEHFRNSAENLKKEIVKSL